MSGPKTFLQMLFDREEGELTCFSPNPYGTLLDSQPEEKDVFFSINPLQLGRADANVTCHRNILLECDKMPLEQQIAYIQQKIPVTSIVYSGGKSYHFIISLQQPCVDRADYDHLVRRLHALLPEVDPTTKNPSRFSRLPGATRPDTGKQQDLVYLGDRIDRATLEALLPPVEPPKPLQRPPAGFFSPLVVDSMFYPEAVMAKLGIESRNSFFFWIGQRLLEAEAPYEQRLSIIENVYTKLRDKAGFSLKEARNAGRVNQ